MGGCLHSLSSCGTVLSAPFQSSVGLFSGWDRPGHHRSRTPSLPLSNKGQISMRLTGTSEAGVRCVTLIKGLQPEPWASGQFQNSMFNLPAGTRRLPSIRGTGTARTQEDTAMLSLHHLQWHCLPPHCCCQGSVTVSGLAESEMGPQRVLICITDVQKGGEPGCFVS